MTSEFLIATGAVALAEMGDKTQLLALCLSACLRRPLPIIVGIFLATLLNHAAAGAAGHYLGAWLEGAALKWILGFSFLAMAGWVLLPDKMEEEPKASDRWGAFIAAFTAFFLAEMGDKTQIATIALAMQAHSVVQVVLGTTLGMMIANVPVVLFGIRVMRKIPMALMRKGAAAAFAAIGITALLSASGLL
jgi:putative Ca2+/H+ antiporter (TMEM165/GDT1 family)